MQHRVQYLWAQLKYSSILQTFHYGLAKRDIDYCALKGFLQKIILKT